MKVIPEEIAEALNQSYGFILLIKGKAGTGKSTLALEILNAVENSNPIYISTRINPNLIYKQFPWIEQFLPEKNIIDATAFEFEHPLPLDDQYSFFNSLKLQKFPDFVKTLFLRIDSAQSGTVVIDSWDALTTLSEASWGKSTSLLANYILELIRQKNLNLILIEETEQESYLDYLVDGIVILKEALFDADNRVRHLQLKKLRGVSIEQHSYLFTLYKGRFTTFLPTQPFDVKLITNHSLIKDKNSKVSTGIQDLDEILNGGIERGSVLLFEIEPYIGFEFSAFVDKTVINYILQKRGVVGLPPPEINPLPEVALIKKIIRDDDLFNSCFRIIEIGKEKASLPPYRVRVLPESDFEYFNHIRKVIRDLIESKANPPILIHLGLNNVTFNFTYEEIKRDTPIVISQIKKSGNVLFITAKMGDEFIKDLRKVVDVHFKLSKIDRKLIFYGVNPKTNVYAVNFLISEGILTVHLIPIV